MMQLTHNKTGLGPTPLDPLGNLALPRSTEASAAHESNLESFPLDATRSLSRLLVEQVARADSVSGGSVFLSVSNLDKLLAKSPTTDQIADALDSIRDMLVGPTMKDTCPEITADLLGIVLRMKAMTGLPYIPLALYPEKLVDDGLSAPPA